MFTSLIEILFHNRKNSFHASLSCMAENQSISIIVLKYLGLGISVPKPNFLREFRCIYLPFIYVWKEVVLDQVYKVQ